MKRLLTIVLFITAAAAAVVVAQRMMPPEPIPPTAHTVSCGEGTRTALEMPQFVETLRSAGCNHIDLEYLSDGYYLVRGTKVVIQNP